MRAKSSFERNKSVGTNTRAIWKRRRVFKATEALQIGFFPLSREKKRKKRKASRRNEKLLLSGSAFYWVTRSGKCQPGAAPYRQNERFYWCSILFFLSFRIWRNFFPFTNMRTHKFWVPGPSSTLTCMRERSGGRGKGILRKEDGTTRQGLLSWKLEFSTLLAYFWSNGFLLRGDLRKMRDQIGRRGSLFSAYIACQKRSKYGSLRA